MRSPGEERARAFYLRYGFLPFPERLHRLFLPMESIARLWAKAGPAERKT